MAGKADASYLIISSSTFSQDLEQSTPSAVAKVREEVRCRRYLIFSPVYNFSIPGSVKTWVRTGSLVHLIFLIRGASAINEKIVTVSSVANAGQEPMFAIYKDFLLPFIRTTAVGVNSPARQ